MKAMMRTKLRAFSCMCFAAALASCSGGGTLPQGTVAHSSTTLSSTHAPRYRLVILGDGLRPQKINDAGVIVGTDIFKGAQGLPFEYKNGQVTDLPLLPGDTTGDAYDINSRGQIVGRSFNPEALFSSLQNHCVSMCAQMHAVLWQHGRIVNLGAIPQAAGSPASIYNAALAINNSGEIVGYSGFPDENGITDLTIFSPGEARAIRVGGTIMKGAPFEVNNAGEIVGDSSPGFPTLDPFAYPKSIVCSPPLDDPGIITGINNRGDTISYGSPAATPASLFCKHGIGFRLTMNATGINDRDDLVGSATSGSSLNDDSLLYSNGTYFGLNSLIENPVNGLTVVGPQSINNQREIVGFTFADNLQNLELRGWLLVPDGLTPSSQ